MIGTCNRCQRERPVHNKKHGLCASCYTMHLRESRGKKPCEGCAEARPIVARGLCSPCYNKLWNLERTQRDYPGQRLSFSSRTPEERLFAKLEAERRAAEAKAERRRKKAEAEAEKARKKIERELARNDGIPRDYRGCRLQECENCGFFGPHAAKKLCWPCYYYAKRHGGAMRPPETIEHAMLTKARQIAGPQPCANCGKEPTGSTPFTRGLCNACYEHWRKHGEHRQPSKPRVIEDTRCKVCQRLAVHIRKYLRDGRCQACDAFFEANGRDIRPEEMQRNRAERWS